VGRSVASLAAAVLVVACLISLSARQDVAPTVLGVAGDRMTVDGTPRFLTFISYFDGVRRAGGSGADEDLGYLARHVDGIRVLPNWWASTCPVRSGDDSLIDVDGHIRPASWTNLQRLLDTASSRSLLVDLTFTRETVTDNGTPRRVLSHAAYEAALVELIGSPSYFKGRYRNMLVDVQNEWTRFATLSETDSLLRRLREADPGRVLAASVSGEAYVPAARQLPNMVAAYHDPRGRDWFNDETVARQVRGVRALVAQPVYLQEPMPISTVCAGQIVDRDPTHFSRAREAARSSGAAAWTFHTRTTFDLSGKSLVEKLAQPENEAERHAIDQLQR